VTDLRTHRIAALVDGLTAAHLDGLLLTGLSNIRYLTGFSGSSALLVVTPRDVVLITDFRYQTQVADEVGELARVAIEASSLWTGLWQQLAHMPVKVLGFETAHIQHRDFQRLVEAGARWQWRPTMDLVETLRERHAHWVARCRRCTSACRSCRWPACWRKRCATREARVSPFLPSSRVGRAPHCHTRARQREHWSRGTFC
jgi:hypothetical protein